MPEQQELAETASQFLGMMLRHLRDDEGDMDWCLDPTQSQLAADALETALQISGGLPAELSPGKPQPCLGWQVACNECTYEPVRWTGIAYSEQGAMALLQHHQSHAHR